MLASPEEVEKEEGIIQVDMDQINHQDQITQLDQIKHQDQITQLDQHEQPSHSFQQRKLPVKKIWF